MKVKNVTVFELELNEEELQALIAVLEERITQNAEEAMDPYMNGAFMMLQKMYHDMREALGGKV